MSIKASKNILIRVETDLDGVLADFDKRALEILGKPFIKGDNSIWSEITKHQEFFRELQVLPDAYELWEYLTLHFARVEILTAIPRKSTLPLAEYHKREWVAKHFGKEIVVKTGPYAVDKQNHCVPNTNHILIDDNVKNIAQWSSRGGIGIFHTDADSTIQCLEWFRKNHEGFK